MRAILLGAVVLVFPLATAAVFACGYSRDAAADVVAVVYSVGLFLAFSSSLWPLPSLRSWTRRARIQSLCMLFLGVSYATHLSWELGWLWLHDAIASHRDAAWAYPWWAYIDGGDLRYAQAPATLLTMEALSVCNGLLGVLGFWLWFRSRHSDVRAVLLFMATAVVHLYSTFLYVGGEIIDGLPNVDTSSFVDCWIKFGLANAPWLLCPWFVIYWGVGTVGRMRMDQPTSSQS